MFRAQFCDATSVAYKKWHAWSTPIRLSKKPKIIKIGPLTVKWEQISWGEIDIFEDFQTSKTTKITAGRWWGPPDARKLLPKHVLVTYWSYRLILILCGASHLQKSQGSWFLWLLLCHGNVPLRSCQETSHQRPGTHGTSLGTSDFTQKKQEHVRGSR